MLVDLRAFIGVWEAWESVVHLVVSLIAECLRIVDNANVAMAVRIIAAIFFTAYETLKKTLPQNASIFASHPAFTHMTAATVGEVVCLFFELSCLQLRLTQCSLYACHDRHLA